jgi:hypothetical protein
MEFCSDSKGIIEGAVRGSAVFKITLEHCGAKYKVNIFHRDPTEEDGWNFMPDYYDRYTEAKDAYDEALRKYHFVDDNASSAGNNVDKNENIPTI